MKSISSWSRPAQICLAYLPALLISCFWLWLYSGQIDASPRRGLLYVVVFGVLPLVTLAFLIHLTVALSTPGTIKKRLASAAVCALIGMAWLHFGIQGSSDGEAEMLYLVMPIVGGVSAAAGLIISTVVFYILEKIKKASPH